jgi:hypothetical protein
VEREGGGAASIQRSERGQPPDINNRKRAKPLFYNFFKKKKFSV